MSLSKTGRRIDNTSDDIKNAKRYIAAVSHTEVMYSVLKKNGNISPDEGKIIVSGKCPCSDCDIFITDEHYKPVFSESKMIGYAYGWMSQDSINEKNPIDYIVSK